MTLYCSSFSVKSLLDLQGYYVESTKVLWNCSFLLLLFFLFCFLFCLFVCFVKTLCTRKKVMWQKMTLSSSSIFNIQLLRRYPHQWIRPHAVLFWEYYQIPCLPAYLIRYEFFENRDHFLHTFVFFLTPLAVLFIFYDWHLVYFICRFYSAWLK